MHNLHDYIAVEHLCEPMAEYLSILAKEFDHAQLGDKILREISGKWFGAQDTRGPRAFSWFSIRFSEEALRSVLKQISLLIEWTLSTGPNCMCACSLSSCRCLSIAISGRISSARIAWRTHQLLRRDVKMRDQQPGRFQSSPQGARMGKHFDIRR